MAVAPTVHHISCHVQLAFRLRDEDLRVAAILCEVILQDDWKGPAAWLRTVWLQSLWIWAQDT